MGEDPLALVACASSGKPRSVHVWLCALLSPGCSLLARCGDGGTQQQGLSTSRNTTGTPGNKHHGIIALWTDSARTLARTSACESASTRSPQDLQMPHGCGSAN